MSVTRGLPRRRGLAARTCVASVVLGALIAGIFVVLILATAGLREAQDESESTHRLLSDARRVLGLTVDLESGQRGFLVTQEEAFLQPWEAAQRDLPSAVSALRRGAGGDPVARVRVEELVGMIDAYLHDYSLPLVETARVDLEAARERASTGEGKRRVDRIRTVFQALEAPLLDGTEARSDRAAEETTRATVIGAAGLGLSMLLIVAFALRLRRLVVKPVRRVAEAARRCADGEVGVRVDESGVGELADLGRSFNQMATNLEAVHDELESQNVELQSQQAELEGILDELASERSRAERLYRFGQTLAGETELRALARLALRELCDFAEAAVGALYLRLDGPEAPAELVASRGLDRTRLTEQIAAGADLPGRAMEEGRIEAADWGAADLRLEAFGTGVAVHQELHLPLTDGDGSLGVLTMARAGDRPLPAADIQAIGHLARQAAVALTSARTLRELRRQASITRAVLDAAPVAISLVDLKGQAVLANQRMRDWGSLRGVAPEGDVYARALASAHLMVDPDGYREGVRRIAADPEREAHDSYTIRDSGRVFDRDTAPVRDGSGTPIGRVVVLREVTAERQAERLRDEFVALVSHELRTPLTSIMGYLEVVLLGQAGALNEEQTHFLRVVDRNARRLLDLVGDLIIVAQSEAGQLAVHPVPADLGEAVRESVQAAEPTASPRDVELTVEVAGPLPVLADRARIGQVLDNLLSNALKFTPAGGSVRVRAMAVGGDAVVEVQDTGIGIPAAEQGRLFERFFRSSRSNAEQIPGTGLGLAISKAIAEAHRGSIRVKSVEGKGSTFRVEIPLLAAPAPAWSGRQTAVLEAGGLTR